MEEQKMTPDINGELAKALIKARTLAQDVQGQEPDDKEAQIVICAINALMAMMRLDQDALHHMVRTLALFVKVRGISRFDCIDAMIEALRRVG